MKEEKLFIEADGLKIFPWTTAQILKLSPTLKEVIFLAMDKGISLQELKNLSGDKKKMIELAFDFFPFFSPIVSGTLNISEEEIGNWGFTKLLRAVLIILIQNASELKQFVFLMNSTLKNSKEIFLN